MGTSYLIEYLNSFFCKYIYYNTQTHNIYVRHANVVLDGNRTYNRNPQSAEGSATTNWAEASHTNFSSYKLHTYATLKDPDTEKLCGTESIMENFNNIMVAKVKFC